ncbi:conserved hypothetical protein [Agrobacterium fabacearum CFBP 5771]|uniref:hypothetical protein n=1 Tax=Agrobacterium tumefaciens TaxID=358 RepID=UPI0009BBAA53|nr:hypothetical protein [Agrobacterium tumefaciens]CVI17422.1 conserved hypothetical protein [Agrobacterium fabacearum CFBP 5771]
MKRAEGNRMMAERYRNRYAKKLFNPATIATAIDAVAMEGHRQYRVVQELPFDLSNTVAAKNLEIWLKEESFEFAWRPCFLEQDAFRPEIRTEYAEMLVFW